MGLKELLAAYGVRQPSSATPLRKGADDEGAGGVRQPSPGTPTHEGADDEGAGGVRQLTATFTAEPSLGDGEAVVLNQAWPRRPLKIRILGK